MNTVSTLCLSSSSCQCVWTGAPIRPSWLHRGQLLPRDRKSSDWTSCQPIRHLYLWPERTGALLYCQPPAGQHTHTHTLSRGERFNLCCENSDFLLITFLMYPHVPAPSLSTCHNTQHRVVSARETGMVCLFSLSCIHPSSSFNPHSSIFICSSVCLFVTQFP